jgi:hypothetical protein
VKDKDSLIVLLEATDDGAYLAMICHVNEYGTYP